MATVIDDEFMVCADCLMAIANDDYSGIDEYLTEPEASERVKQIKAGIESAGGPIFACGDSERDEEFSRQSCDCCGSRLAGSRHHCVVLSD